MTHCTRISGYDPLSKYPATHHVLACVAGARKGKGEGKINWARAKYFSSKKKTTNSTHTFMQTSSKIGIQWYMSPRCT